MPEEAERHGLVTAVTALHELLPAALALARRIKQLSPMAIAEAKASVHVAADTDLRSARRYGLEALALLVGSPDWQEGMRAFIEKREPRF
jgi:enoyl-CoA hydratase/carnithine racemase